MAKPIPKFAMRAMLALALWGMLSFLFAVFAPFTLEAGEQIGMVRVVAFLKGPQLASIGLASLLTRSFSPSGSFAIPTVVLFAALLIFTCTCKRRSVFLALLSVQAALIGASLLQAARMIQYWNNHGHG